MKIFLPDEVAGDRLPRRGREVHTSRIVDGVLGVSVALVVIVLIAGIMAVNPY